MHPKIHPHRYPLEVTDAMRGAVYPAWSDFAAENILPESDLQAQLTSVIVL
jgi:hypothetical protein